MGCECAGNKIVWTSRDLLLTDLSCEDPYKKDSESTLALLLDPVNASACVYRQRLLFPNICDDNPDSELKSGVLMTEGGSELSDNSSTKPASTARSVF